jgi:response regulator RpfG family c-di-GMP phosphodiesterase
MNNIATRNINTLYFIDDSEDEKFLTELLFESQKIQLTLKHFDNVSKFEDFFIENSLSLNAVDLLVVDLNMPIKNGIDTIKYLKSKDQYNALIMGICTGSEDPADRESAMSVGAEFFIKKPLDKKALERVCNLVPVLKLFTVSGTVNLQLDLNQNMQ